MTPRGPHGKLPPMSVSPARRIAFDVLQRVQAEGAFAADLLNAQLTEAVRREDAALATELTLGVLRWQGLLDFLLERHLEKPAAILDLEVRLALRLGVYQLRFLERVPARAAVSESVEIVKRARKSSAASLVNAVLRRIAPTAREPVEALLPGGLSPVSRLAVLYSHPAWMVERWVARMGEERTAALLAANNRPHQLACAVHDAVHREKAVEDLRGAGLRVEPGALLRDALRISGGSPTRTEAFRRGWISVQDEASQTIPLLLETATGQEVLDLCAAPGSKTAHLARAAVPAWVVAADIHPHRLTAMRKHLVRLGIANVALIALDATRPLPLAKQYRRILVDAPCSGTGTLAHNPEIRWRLRPEDLADLRRRQIGLLGTALHHLAPGGRLVYSTCSLEPEENEDVVTEALRRTPGTRVVDASRLTISLAPHLAAGVRAAALFDAASAFRMFPAEYPTDGFFAVVIERVQSS
jgi:16S rRNA (cytosine967-C5)-methyltransferase